jgi:hypothetical protein
LVLQRKLIANAPQNAVKRRKTPQNAAKRRKTPQNAAKRRKTPQNAIPPRRGRQQTCFHVVSIHLAPNGAPLCMFLCLPPVHLINEVVSKTRGFKSHDS